ncbi:MAG: tRNA uridine(34) 5-carboxymethylaminomethyl modification radical SAM/GNAT enzyme Elp3, partial [Candidatus Micrarchaeia archaeon]
MRDKAAEEAAARIACGEDIHLVKREISSKYGINPLRNSEILAFAGDHRVKLINKTRLRPTRTLSGVAPIAVMSRSSCPHGSCSYCP